MSEGDRTIQELGQIMPGEAPAAVEELYDDVRRVLGVPFVNSLFRVLANRHEYLREAWRSVRPVLCSPAFEKAAEDLRGRTLVDGAVENAPEAGWQDFEHGERFARFTQSIHYVLPKLLLIATAWRSGRTAPSQGVSSTGAPRPPEAQVRIELVNPEEAQGEVAELFRRIQSRHGHPAVASWYRALAQQPALLEAAWTRVEPHVGSGAWNATHEALLERARQHVERLFEPSEPRPDGEVRSVLEVFQTKLIPDLCLDVALVRAWLDPSECGPWHGGCRRRGVQAESSCAGRRCPSSSVAARHDRRGERHMAISHTESYPHAASRERAASSPVRKAYQALHVVFVAIPVIAGLDKFTMWLADWHKYMASVFESLMPFNPHYFMYGAGIVEVIAGLVVAVKPRIGGWLVAGWLTAVTINLAIGGYWDIALRDVGLVVGAAALALLSPVARRTRD